jgi:hypothetical protein
VNIFWKSSSSKKKTLRAKLTETLEKLAEIKEIYPELNNDAIIPGVSEVSSDFYDVILSVSCVCGYDESLFGSVWIVAEESLWCILQEDKCSAEETLLAADGFVRRINAPRRKLSWLRMDLCGG